jgi:hypothetical protein
MLGAAACWMQRPHSHHTGNEPKNTALGLDGAAGLEERPCDTSNAICCKLMADREQNCGAAQLMRLGDFYELANCDCGASRLHPGAGP